MSLQLPETDITATVDFQSTKLAYDFAIAYSRKTLMGHSVGHGKVTVWNVTPTIEQWINEYIENLSCTH